MRILVVLSPIVASFGVTRFVSPVLWHRPGWLGLAGFVAQVAVVGSATALLADRAARRLLPLADLLNMTLVFPDRAPSRFGIALRTGTLRQLSSSLSERETVWPPDRQGAAERLVAMVAALGRHERLTRGHTERVRAYSDLIGQGLGLNAEDREMLQWASLVHDIGKLTVPAEILNKDGALSDDEWEVLVRHPAAGGELVEPLASWLGPWRFAASQHHERWDGAGYPLGLAGTDIALAGRIVAVADAFDVITSNRSYKTALSHEAARQELVRCSGAQFDPAVVRALLNASLDRSRPAIGFIGWFTELGGLSAIPRGVGQLATATATAAVIVVGAVGANGIMSDSTANATGTPGAPAPPILIGSSESLPYSFDQIDDGNQQLESAAATQAIGQPNPYVEPAPSITADAQTLTTDPQNLNGTTATSTPTAAGAITTAATSPNLTSPPRANPTPSTTSVQSTSPATVAPTTTSTTTPGAPLAGNDTISAQNDKDVKIHVLDNDDPGNAPFDETTLQIITNPSHSTDFRVHNDHLHYRATKGYVGFDTIEYRICNTNGLCHTAQIAITVS